MSDDDHGVRPSEDAEGASPKAAGQRFPTVGIGTSAGGVHALQMFFESLSDDVDAAFVVVLHLDPWRQSELSSILAARTRMPVTQVTALTPIEPRHVYVIPPNRQLRATDHHLAITEFDEPRWQRGPIDLFFRSLAAEGGDNFAIVFSGAGSDGSVGIKAVKEAAGIILVQDPDEAEYGSMPRSAVATGLADFVLPVREIAARLPELIRNRRSLLSDDLTETDGEAMQRILSHLRSARDTTSRVTRSRQLADASRAECRFSGRRRWRTTSWSCAKSSGGAGAVRRSPYLGDDVLPRYERVRQACGVGHPSPVRRQGGGGSIRVWVPGCATGEEAYSIAILLLEEAGRHEIRCGLQVFASDLDDSALIVAREGRYPIAIEADMTEERLRRFFIREGDHYRVTRELRDMASSQSTAFSRIRHFRDSTSSPVGTSSSTSTGRCNSRFAPHSTLPCPFGLPLPRPSETETAPSERPRHRPRISYLPTHVHSGRVAGCAADRRRDIWNSALAAANYGPISRAG